VALGLTVGGLADPRREWCIGSDRLLTTSTPSRSCHEPHPGADHDHHDRATTTTVAPTTTTTAAPTTTTTAAHRQCRPSAGISSDFAINVDTATDLG
jgi:hypothetical protein